MRLNPDQRTVATGMAGGTLFSLFFLSLGWAVDPFPAPAAETVAERLAYAFRCDVFAALALLAGVARVAMQRFFENEIDGSVAPHTHSLEIHRAYIQNTTEQLLLLLAAHLAFAAVEPASHLRLLPLLVTLFLIGRTAFWIGYFRNPPSRAFGFVTTFYPTIGVLVYDVVRIAAG